MKKIFASLFIAASMLISAVAMAAPTNTENDSTLTITNDRDAYCYFIDGDHAAPTDAVMNPNPASDPDFNDWTLDDDAAADFNFDLTGNIADNGLAGDDTEFIAYGANCTGTKINFSLSDMGGLGTGNGMGVFSLWVDGQIEAVPTGITLIPGALPNAAGTSTVGISTPNQDRVSGVKLQLSAVGVHPSSGTYNGVLAITISGI